MGNTDEEELRSNRYWPYDNEDQWKCAHWFVYPKRKLNEEIPTGCCRDKPSWVKEHARFAGLNDFNNRLEMLHAKGGEWVTKNLSRKLTSP